MSRSSNTSSSSLPAASASSHSSDDQHDNASGDVQSLRVRTLNSRLRQRRTVYLPDPMQESRARYLGSTGPDSTRIRLEPNGQHRVVFGRDAKRARPSPPWKIVATESEAQELVRQHRAKRTAG